MLKYRPIRPDILDYIEKIDDPDARAAACCIIGVIADTARTRAILKSCSGEIGFFQQLAAWRMTLTALPVKSRRPRKGKLWRPPNRLPSLFEDRTPKPPAADALPWANSEQPMPQNGEDYEKIWGDLVATSTLNVDDGLFPGDPAAGAVFLDLVVGLTELQKKEIVDAWEKAKANPRLTFNPAGSLLEAFGVELPAADSEQTILLEPLPMRSRRRKRQNRNCGNLFTSGAKS